jgi:hypothetical protein
MVFNVGMSKAPQQDIALIHKLGGPAALADRLGYSVQRVQHWLVRGIPPAVKLQHPALFLPQFSPVAHEKRATPTRRVAQRRVTVERRSGNDRRDAK